MLGKRTLQLLALGFLAGCGGSTLVGGSGAEGQESESTLGSRPDFCSTGVNNLCLVPGFHLNCGSSGPNTWANGWERFQAICVRGQVGREAFCSDPSAVGSQNACNSFPGTCSGNGWVLGWDWYQKSCAQNPPPASACQTTTPTLDGLNQLLAAWDQDFSQNRCTTGAAATPLLVSSVASGASQFAPAPAYGHPEVVNEGAPRSAFLRYALARGDFKDLAQTGATAPRGIAHEVTMLSPNPMDDWANRKEMTVLVRARVDYNHAATWADGKRAMFTSNLVSRDGLWQLALVDQNLHFSFSTNGGPIWMRSWKFQGQKQEFAMPLGKWVLIGGRVNGTKHTATLFAVEDGVLKRFEGLRSGRSGADEDVWVGDRLTEAKDWQKIITLGPGQYDFNDRGDADLYEMQQAAGVVVDVDDVRYYSRALSDQDLLNIAAGLR